MPRERDKPRRRPKPAYPKVGSGEDFPARRPGTKVGEGPRGRQVKQSTRTTQARRTKARRRFEADPLEPSRGRNVTPLPNWQYGKPTGRRQAPFSHGVRGKPTKRNPWPL